MSVDHQERLSSSSSTIDVVFPDTNIFLHFTFFPEIPWTTIVGAAQVTIAISPVTVSEIDSHKYDSSSARVRDRARKITKKLGELVDSGGPVRPNVRIEFIDHEPVDFDRYQLTRSSQDDQLLATILQYRETCPDRKVLLVTNDIGLKVKARARGIRVVPLPDSYLLTEPDLREKKIKELERKVRELESQAPLLKLDCGEESDRIEIERPSAFLDEFTFIEQGMRKIKSDYPKLDLPSQSIRGANLVNALADTVSSESIADYNQSLDEFFEKYKEYLFSCYRIREIRTRAAKIDLNVSNVGTATAVDVKVFVRFPPIVEVEAGTKWQQLPRKPSPPEKPKPAFFWRPSLDINSITRPYVPPLVNIPEALAAPRIIWGGIKRDESSSTVFFEVSKLNHGYSEPCPRDVHVVFPSLEVFSSFKVAYEITAGNLPAKSTGFLHFIVKD
jgi:hypothetical protein